MVSNYMWSFQTTDAPKVIDDKEVNERYNATNMKGSCLIGILFSENVSSNIKLHKGYPFSCFQ